MSIRYRTALEVGVGRRRIFRKADEVENWYLTVFLGFCDNEGSKRSRRDL